MDILIKGVKMPKKGQYLQILIAENGEMSYKHVYYNSPSAGFKLHKSKAVALPEHGDLIDRQDVLSYFDTAFLMGADMDYEDIVGIVSNPKAIPTIVEANNGTDN